jgi:hypothetical protein
MMTDNDRHLDGNAIGGLLQELFGREMTHELGCCGNCGAISPMGETVVYLEAPGIVVRCPACGGVLLVAIARPASVRVTVESLRWIDLADSGT